MGGELDPPYQSQPEPSLNLQFAGAFHIAYAGKCAQSGDDSIQVGDVFRLQNKFHDRLAILAGARVDAADIGTVVADDGGQVLQHARPIVAVDNHPNGIGLLPSAFVRVFRPLDGDAAIGLVEQVLHIRTPPRVDGDAAAASDIADDLFAANGIATSRAIDQQIVLPLHFERLGARIQVQLLN